ncbi:ATP-binding cassette domain-containing protein [Methylicorpusculum oleiharenae]|uniref:ATP-binding cassette domain-containing protein n=1 Tax=Methylicorpusculum oleiharenae TaxID=1338687 RepID=UPI0019D24777|nr:ATP-binding cassette domain-containing protein [Methylicorpusculum oleiharenae]MCD2451689.1 ATP-binding cassette domain-containing protein [Methylicorpusculum oleiharenae]
MIKSVDSMPLLEICHAGYAAGQNNILDDLNFAIEEGEIHALIGTNGTGKSTLARLIMGSEGYRLGSGQIFFAGQDIGEWPLHKRAQLGISMVWQEPALFEGITVRSYLNLGSNQCDLPDCLAQVGLEPSDYLDRLLDKSMSGGERKRIELASMLALRARLCILDEPVSGIDLVSMQNILGVIGRINQNGTSILLITHREEVAAIADRASLLCGGKVIMTGIPEYIISQYKKRHCAICNGKACSYATT